MMCRINAVKHRAIAASAALILGWIACTCAWAASDVVYEAQDRHGMVSYTHVRTPQARVAFTPQTVPLSLASSPVRVASRPTHQSRALQPAIDRLIVVVSAHHGVDPHLVRAVVEVESNFNPHAISPKGASGLMQLMPATAARYKAYDLHDPVKNVEAGVRYLRDLLVLFEGNAELAIAGYNAGEGAVIKYRRRIPPYAETQLYVPRVIAAWKRNRNDTRLIQLMRPAREGTADD